MADLRAESDDLDALVADLPADRWAAATPAPGWTIAHQIAHLLWTDRVAVTTVTDEAGFAALLAEAVKDPTGVVDAGAEELAQLPPDRLLADWRRTRSRLHDELLTAADGRKLPWFGPPMSAASMATRSASGSDAASSISSSGTRTATPPPRRSAFLRRAISTSTRRINCAETPKKCCRFCHRAWSQPSNRRQISLTSAVGCSDRCARSPAR